MSFGIGMGWESVHSCISTQVTDSFVRSSASLWEYGGVLSETADLEQSCDAVPVIGTEKEKKLNVLTSKAFPQSIVHFSPKELNFWVLGVKLNIFQHF